MEGVGLGVDGDGVGVEAEGLGLGVDGDGVGVEAEGLGLGVEDLGEGVEAEDLGEGEAESCGSGILLADGAGAPTGEGLTPSLARAFGVEVLGAGLPNTVSADKVVNLTFSGSESGFFCLLVSWLWEPIIGTINNNKCSPTATVTDGLINVCQDQVEPPISSNSSTGSRAC